MADDKNAAASAGPSGGRAVHGASILILLQIVSRAVTFVANQLLLRFLTAQLLGISTQLEVYYLSVLFFARESLEVAIQRQGQDQGQQPPPQAHQAQRAQESQAAVNLSYLSIALGALLALLFGWIYLLSANAAVLSTPFLAVSLYLYAVAAVVELLAEPALVVMQLRLQFGVRATAESAATFARCAVTLGSAVWAARRGLDIGALPFALGQLSYGSGLLLVYAYYGSSLARAEGFSLWPRRLVAPDYLLSYFYRPTLRLASSMIAQSVVKHLLTQGDTFLVSILSTPTAQGVYALANNYGGLAARLVFQPVEESSRSYFSRLLGSKSDEAKAAAKRASGDLQALLKLYLLFSVLVTALGPVAASPLLSLVTGPRWASSGAGETLAAYMWYIPLLAVNGVAEAFVASVASEAQIHRQSAWMSVFSLIFAATGFVSLRVLNLGAIGLVVANSINMACRISWCLAFIDNYFHNLGVEFGISGLLPSPVALLAAVVTSQTTKRFVRAGPDAGPMDQLLDLTKIAVAAIPLVLVL